MSFGYPFPLQIPTWFMDDPFGSAAAYHDRRQTPFIGSTTCCSVLVFGFSLIVTILNSNQRNVRYENRWQNLLPMRIRVNPYSDIIENLDDAKNIPAEGKLD